MANEEIENEETLEEKVDQTTAGQKLEREGKKRKRGKRSGEQFLKYC